MTTRCQIHLKQNSPSGYHLECKIFVKLGSSLEAGWHNATLIRHVPSAHPKLRNLLLSFAF